MSAVSVLDPSRGPSSEELHQEVRRLRSEIQQLREIVNALFNAVFEDQEEFDSSARGGDENQMYN